jgi:uncharacterized protein YjbI with pentapeptide repeats
LRGVNFSDAVLADADFTNTNMEIWNWM